mmetsp:Transcript_35841/g.86673  ORF Transcript_35841/g.86673 Transcript_35841/m.86673 type:complete len:227 (+) Transcript_35841:653-1333(+)
MIQFKMSPVSFRQKSRNPKSGLEKLFFSSSSVPWYSLPLQVSNSAAKGAHTRKSQQAWWCSASNPNKNNSYIAAVSLVLVSECAKYRIRNISLNLQNRTLRDTLRGDSKPIFRQFVATVLEFELKPRKSITLLGRSFTSRLFFFQITPRISLPSFTFAWFHCFWLLIRSLAFREHENSNIMFVFAFHYVIRDMAERNLSQVQIGFFFHFSNGTLLPGLEHFQMTSR